jgi:enamine deaminase RidA (YjgF/YER057c/UK114 family)
MIVERKIINPWQWQDQFGFVWANDISGAKRILFLSGQASVDAEGRPVHLGDMRAQINQAFDNLDRLKQCWP